MPRTQLQRLRASAWGRWGQWVPHVQRGTASGLQWRHELERSEPAECATQHACKLTTKLCTVSGRHRGQQPTAACGARSRQEPSAAVLEATATAAGGRRVSGHHCSAQHPPQRWRCVYFRGPPHAWCAAFCGASTGTSRWPGTVVACCRCAIAFLLAVQKPSRTVWMLKDVAFMRATIDQVLSHLTSLWWRSSFCGLPLYMCFS